MKDYVIIDLETTGINCHKDRIIEVGALFIEDSLCIDKIDYLVNPECDIKSSVVNLTGITNEIVSGSPTIDVVLPDLISRINRKTIIGHNVIFDLSFLKEACKQLSIDFEYKYIDTLELSKKVIKGLPSYCLENICLAFGIKNEKAHRALSDCHATFECYKKLTDIINTGEIFQLPDADYIKPTSRHQKFSDETKALQELESLFLDITCDNILTEDEVFELKTWLDNNEHLCGNYPFDKAKEAIMKALEDNILEQNELEEMLQVFKNLVNPDFSCSDELKIDINGKNVCVTGDFVFGSRSEVTEYLKNKGASVKSGVSGKTDYLIVGDLGSDAWKHGNYGGKIKTAMEFNEKGKNIIVIAEKDFFDRV